MNNRKRIDYKTLRVSFFCNFFCLFVLNLWQSSILKMYPAEMIVVAFYCLFVTLQALLGALIAERDVAAWRLHADMGLVAIIYAV